MEGDADLVLWGGTPEHGAGSVGVPLPPRGHVKPDRQLWGVIGSGDEARHPMFDMAVRGDGASWGDALGGICGVCMRARQLLTKYCSGEGEGGEEGEEGKEAHTIIMLPEQGHTYAGAQLRHIIIRSLGMPLAGVEDHGGGIRVEIAGPSGQAQVIVLDSMTPLNVNEMPGDPVGAPLPTHL